VLLYTADRAELAPRNVASHETAHCSTARDRSWSSDAVQL